MRMAMACTTIGLLALTGALVYGFGWGGGWAEVGVLMGYPWFVVSLFDVYIGFLLIGVWVFWRERSRAVAALWLVLILTLGNVISCMYVLLALFRSQGDWAVFRDGVHARKCDA